MNWPRRCVRVRVPATTANLGPGFDALGLALALHDEVEAEVTDSGLAIEVSGEGADAAAAGERHLVLRAMRAAFAATAGAQPPGLALRCANAIPQGRGLGSSAGAVVAGLLAARALADPRGPEPSGAVRGLADTPGPQSSGAARGLADTPDRESSGTARGLVGGGPEPSGRPAAWSAAARSRRGRPAAWSTPRARSRPGRSAARPAADRSGCRIAPCSRWPPSSRGTRTTRRPVWPAG